MVSLESIKKTHLKVFEGGIYQLVYPQDKEGVFGTSLIEVSEVTQTPPLPILLFHYYSVSQPIWIKNFHYCPSLFQLVDLFFYCIGMLIRGSSRWLFLWASFEIYVQPMAYEVRINPCCFIWVPSEYIDMLLKESHLLVPFYR